MRARSAVLGGDGIGPEVVAEGVRVLHAIARRFGHDFTVREALIGGAALDATGEPLPRATLDLCQGADAVLLGAVGGPKWDDPTASVRPEQGLLGLRKALGVFANLRPVRHYPALAAASPIRADRLEGVDIMVVRELTGGIYFGEKSRGSLPDGAGEVATDLCSYSTPEIERVVRVACQLAMGRRQRLTSVDKANVLETSRLWRRTTERLVRREFPGLELEHLLVDSTAMDLIRRPAHFDVIVTENMFGDILTDEASLLAGSIGVLPSASLGSPRADGATGKVPGLYEPIHGSAPGIAGQNVANPIGTILSVAMLLRHSLGLEAEARAVEAAVDAALNAGELTADAVPRGARAWATTEVGAAIAERVARDGAANAKGGA